MHFYDADVWKEKRQIISNTGGVITKIEGGSYEGWFAISDPQKVLKPGDQCTLITESGKEYDITIEYYKRRDSVWFAGSEAKAKSTQS